MSSPQDVQAILLSIVNDLEKTASGMTYILAEIQKLTGDSRASATTKLDLAAQEHRAYYDSIRAKIEALGSSKGTK